MTKQYKTLAAAMADGWKRPHLSRLYGHGAMIEVKGVVLFEHVDEAFSKSAWEKAGFEIADDAEPHVKVGGKYCNHFVYRHDQVAKVAADAKRPTTSWKGRGKKSSDHGGQAPGKEVDHD
jgi:hypothetical protein